MTWYDRQKDAMFRILKFNPYHDKAGRFASRGGAANAAPDVAQSPDADKKRREVDEFMKMPLEGGEGNNATGGDSKPRRLSDIARDIRKEWGSKVNYAAKPYLEALSELDSIDDNYYQDSARSVATYFLANASTFRGPRAKELKNELKKLLGVK